MAGEPMQALQAHHRPSAEDASGTALALFDLDRTLLTGSSLVALGRAMVAHGFVARRNLLGAALRDARFRRRGADDAAAARLRAQALSAIAGLERAPLLELARSVGAELAATIEPGARLLVERHLAHGDFCVVLSASPQELVDAFAVALGAHRAVGTRAAVDDGCFTGKLDGEFCYGAGKLARLHEGLGPVELRNAFAYADSTSDLPLLRAVGRPVAVNPDRRLRAVAHDRGWPILRTR